MGEREEREGAASLKDASNNKKIYNAIASGQGITTNNAKDAKNDGDKEGSMVGIPQFWVYKRVHMEAVSKLIMGRDIYCLEHLTDVTC